MGLKQFFVDDAGQFSCMRLMCFCTTITVLSVWLWANFRAGTYVPLGYAEAGLVGAAHGGKMFQGRAEYGDWRP